MTYDIYVMYLCHWHKSQEKGILEKKHSLASVWSFLLQERLMVTHHLFILIVLTPITQVRAAAGVQDHLHMLGVGSWTPLCRALCSVLPFFTALQGRAGRLLCGLHLHSRAEHTFCFTGQNPHAGRSGGMGLRAGKPPAICHLSPVPLQAVAELGGVSERGSTTAVAQLSPAVLPSSQCPIPFPQ